MSRNSDPSKWVFTAKDLLDSEALSHLWDHGWEVESFEAIEGGFKYTCKQVPPEEQ